ncbi:hypothetical protein [Bradyrhizobium commune]|uniref:Uncharacterized protein n=1 Tax=Bradyrhizobium commune TaxID=83627 RepID=A0A7S9D144_9BRAD|nr:hypothetical protein [Bradyrhizobium commune]QPF89262.1 hypothetical protein IC761_22405 [Bradyrhizobium commune]
MSRNSRAYVYASAAAGLLSVASTSSFAAPCTGPGAPTTTQTKCLTAIQIPGIPLQSFDISWVNPKRAEMYFADRSNAGIEVIDTRSLTWKRLLPGFVGAVHNANGTVNNNISGPDGVVSHGRWLYAGDGDSTLKVFDLDGASTAVASIATGGTTRVDEMALTSHGKRLLVANNAEDPPFATLFAANGNAAKNHVSIIARIIVDQAIIPAGAGLSLEQPSWDPTTKRFFNSIPIIANNPAGCNYGQLSGPITCHGGVLVIDPKTVTGPTTQLGAFDPATNTGVIALNGCSPNGSTVGPDDRILLGCTPQNNPNDVIQLVINSVNKKQTPIANITGSDEVWFNWGDDRYYTGSSRNCKAFPPPGGNCAAVSQQQAVLGVINARSNQLIETIPQSSNSHSVAADSKRNLIFVPQVAPASVVIGGDTTSVGAGLCGQATNGCVAVFQHKIEGKDDDDDRDDDEAEF